MGKNKLTLGACLFLFSCINHSNKDAEVSQYWQTPSNKTEVQYAKGFEIEYFSDYTLIVTQSLAGNSSFKDSVFLPYFEQANIPKNAKYLLPENLFVACQSSTHLSYLKKLGQLEKVKGVCGMDYIEDHNLLIDLESNGVREICMGEELQKETLLEIDPALYFIYPFSSGQKEEIEKDGIKTFMIGEYLETEPLARLEWIKLFGELYNKNAEAGSYFTEVEKQYHSLAVDHPDTAKKFILNVPYGDSWYTPSSNSLVVTLLEDAGLYYYFQHEVGTENTPHTKEEIWLTGEEVPYWVIIASRPENFTLADLIAEEPVYNTFKSVKQGQVIFCNTATSNYFIDGVVEPQVMLKDILFAIGDLQNHSPKYFHLLK